MSIENLAVNEELLTRARALVAALEAGDGKEAASVLDDMTQMRESELFQEVGKLTRQVHDALVNFEFDPNLEQLASREIPDAKERLHYVMTMTNQAANRTLNAVEEALPACDRLLDTSSKLGDQWGRFMRREMSVDDFRAVTKDLSGFFGDAERQIEDLKVQLNEVLMAQEFQDLTSQVINRVIKLVEDVENNLVNLIKITGGLANRSDKQSVEDGSALDGPQVPTLKSSSAVSGQDEVDDLLSSLGF